MESVVPTNTSGTMYGMAERYATFRTDAKGRTVIPAALRAQAGISEGGDVLVGHVEDERLIIETRATIKRRLQAQAAATEASGVVDRLLADRRADMESEKPAQPAAEA
jgi:AbrB family looped-hinge helix DNA binding protein